jgi:hypothetical protein
MSPNKEDSMAIKVNDVIEHRHWGQGVVTEVGKDISGRGPLRAGTVRVRFMVNGPEDWNLWVLNDDCDVIVRR